MNSAAVLHPLLALALAPLLPGVVARTKSFFGGRRGPPLLQLYFDLAKLLRKGAVFSRTTTALFCLGPAAGLACVTTALVLMPLGAVPPVVSFAGDAIAVVGLLAAARFVTMLAALDTGSAFEGMGASREAAFAALAEPALLIGLAALARGADGALSLGGMMGAVSAAGWTAHPQVYTLLAAAFLGVVLAENARIPVDDPNTHLELTMIHEVMVLDHGGPDFAMIQYGAALKLWVTGALVVGLVVPVRTGHVGLDLAAGVGGQLLLAVGIGCVESSMARLRLVRVPHLLVGAGALSALAFLLSVWGYA